ncbi:unnamed protein product, partial [Nesidiocoris tenuis]
YEVVTLRIPRTFQTRECPRVLTLGARDATAKDAPEKQSPVIEILRTPSCCHVRHAAARLFVDHLLQQFHTLSGTVRAVPAIPT